MSNMTQKQMRDELERLQAENQALKDAKTARTSLSVKLSKKGAFSVYGLGRFPTTLYREQWERLFAFQSSIEDLMAETPESMQSTKDNPVYHEHLDKTKTTDSSPSTTPNEDGVSPAQYAQIIAMIKENEG